MARNIIKRYMPDGHKIRAHKHLRMFGQRLHELNLWHLNRYSVSGSVAVGLFWAFAPIPFQMIPSAVTAIWQPFFLGSFVVAGLASATSYPAMRGFWRLQTVRQWERRKRVQERKT